MAIVDTGIASVPDLNVAGGYNCSTSDHTAWRDKNNHGTHVAGIVGALDNSFGVVGVAPGARMWAVKILNDDGYGLISWYICGLDWILAQRDPNDASRPLFEAVNMSVTKYGKDDRNCGNTNDDPLHQAICRVVAGGITVVAAAANDHHNAGLNIPASYNEVITVSALADTDGKPGGLGGHRCYSWGGYDKDDTFADFSNYGGDVDLIAPGKCILSTLATGGYGYMSGTSMAAPTVTGAVALYKASRPNATPAEVREALRYLGNLNWKMSTDPDKTHEPLLDVSRIGPLGTFSAGAGRPDPADRRGRHDARRPVHRDAQCDVLRAGRSRHHVGARRLDDDPRCVEPDGLDRQRRLRDRDRPEGHAPGDLHRRRPGDQPGPHERQHHLDQRRRERPDRDRADDPGPDHHEDRPDLDARPGRLGGGDRPDQPDRGL